MRTHTFCLGVAFSANMFTLFVFYELMSLFTYPLIIHDGTEVARKAGLKYLAYSITAGTILLAAMVLQYFYGHTLAFIGHGTLPLARASTTAMLTIFALYMLGFGVKACIMPLHGWVPDAHPAAPSPASAVLSGVILKVGIFGIIRVAFEVFGAGALERLGVGLPTRLSGQQGRCRRGWMHRACTPGPLTQARTWPWESHWSLWQPRSFCCW